MFRFRLRRGLSRAGILAAVAASIQCGGDTAPVVPILAITGGNTQSASVNTAVAIAPSVTVTNQTGAPLPGISVTFAVASGGGTVTGPTQTTSAAGVATVGSWKLGNTLGANTLTASATGATTAATFTATATAGPATTIALNAGSGQSTIAGGAVPIPPSVKVTDAGGNPVTGAAVTFAIATGGGSITGGSQTTNSSGIATIGSWIPGTVGANTLTATAAGLTGSPITFTATGTLGPAAKLGLTATPPATVQNRAAFSPQPVVQVQDANGNAVAQSGTVVTAAITAGGGTLGGTATATTTSTGAATFTNLSISGTVAARTLVFSATGLTSASAQITTTPGPATTLAISSGNTQSGLAGTLLPVSPTVLATDADANGVSGVAVTFAVAIGGGSGTGLTQTTAASGLASVGGWTLGPASGANTMTATSAGLTGSPVTFTATASTLSVTSVAATLLTPGLSTTIAGTGFSTTAASNAVTIDGVAATVTAATATQLTITVPTTIPCAATHDGTIVVTAGGASGSITKALQVATQQTLTVGQSVIISDPTKVRCNELTTSPGAHYYIDVYNTNTTYSTTGATFQLNGVTATGAAGATAQLAAASIATPNARLDAAKFAAARRTTRGPDAGEAMHLRVMEENVRFLNAHKGEITARRATRGANRSIAAAAPPAVGTIISNVHIPNLNVSNFCSTFYTISARVAYVGTKSIIYEDVANPLAGTIDTTYTQIGQEFDNTMYPILTANFGDPLALDPLTDNNGREIMVFSNQINVNMPALGGFVVSCDLVAPNTTNNTGSNFGEYFYAKVPTIAGTFLDAGNTPPNWRWSIRGTIIHESKHITAFAEKLARSPSPVFEQSWLEESTARVSEELYERAIYSFAQKSNIGYGTSANQVGPYCGIRGCLGRPRGFIRVFQDFASIPTSTSPGGWFTNSEDRSPLGRADASDFSFYATGWSLVRWAVDQASALTESAFLKAIVQETAKSGVANLEARTGRLFADMQPEWTLAMILDDYPAFTPALATLKQPSWNFRDVFAGLQNDFPQTYATAWPLLPFVRTFGAFTFDYHVLPGTASFTELKGTQSAKQLIELKAAGTSTAAAPAELRIAIVRVP